MPFFRTKGIAITGIAASVPSNRLDAEMLKKQFNNAYIDKFVRTTGIAACHHTTDNQTAGDLGFVAAENLISRKNIDRQEIGVLLFVSTSPDYRKPSTSSVLQKRLGITKDCACMDILHGCAGFIYGHQTMMAMMQTSASKYGLLILGETTSKVIDKNDKNVMMFGDAGAAIIYEKQSGIENTTLLRTDGSRFKSLILPAGGFRELHPKKEYFIANDGKKYSKFNLYMDGMEIFSFSTHEVSESASEYLTKVGKEAEDYDIFACHQANRYIIQRLSKKINISKEKVPVCLDRYGNTSSVSIPLLLCDYYGERACGVKSILACGFGIGLAWGVTSFEIDTNYIYPVIETDDFYEEGIL